MLDKTEQVGRYFGYPPCCIKSYEEILSSGGRKSAEQSFIDFVHGGNFIPCQAHAKQVINGEVTLASLITDRKCPLPFPQEPPMEQIDEYLDKIA